MAALVRGVSRGSLASGRPGVAVHVRRAVRALRRQPVKVLYPDGRSETLIRTGPAVSQSAAKPESSSPADELRFERVQPGDKRLARLVSVARSRTFREQQGKILLEGRRLICDALAAGAVPHTLFFSSMQRLRELPLDRLRRASLLRVQFEEIKIWSDLVAPQGVIGIFSRPSPSQLTYPEDQQSQAVPLSLICDNIRDPGNLGTILRCAAAAGCERVLLTKGCVDIWEPKVLRAAMGAHFRLPVTPSLSWDDIPRLLPSSVTVHVADSAVRETPPRGALKPGDLGWISGRNVDKNQRFDEDRDSDSEGSGADGRSPPRVGPRPYHQSWAQVSTALVIGGETHGLSLESLRLAEETSGRRLFVPLANGVESLNSAMAAGILAFEGRRQLLKVLERRKR
ncbi:rRNA methyltransferase 3A, mitochondrial [Denticeps clupeoides]|uniref:rRNA methyltransferase 3A, mitochondrial n=1 Tax=Denticeps clupeoides TaxID=299321 RepID=UPI0010A48DA8|nr:rRNA methyltransferase 3, mitochondrial [Denticeps clupeoides]